MGDVIGWGAIAALMLYAALRGPKEAPFFRLLWLWFGLSIALLEALELRGGYPQWLKWTIIAVAVLIGSASYRCDELGQRTRYAMLWCQLRTNIARVFHR